MAIGSDSGDSRTEVSFHLPLQTFVRERAHYILAHLRPLEHPEILSATFVAIDTQNLSTVVSSTWSDWDDGSEQIAMPTLLQLAVMCRWISAEMVQTPLENWVKFASSSLFDAEGNTRRCTGCTSTQRPYNAIWLVMFFNDRYNWLGNSSDIDTAVILLNKVLEVGGVAKAPTIFFSQAVLDLCKSLDNLGRHNESVEFKNKIVNITMSFINKGQDIPTSEVSYEQAIVEPLVEMAADTYNMTKNTTPLSETKKRLDWLMAFSGPQPRARLYQIANCHWDE
ncbi:amino acid permease family protein [Penicillium odoratum]|uniref:amino acid permease family protein n=1 Tax=Penicillium odoratum TaxID=1167516 RepID=UPI002549513C|nr:amino acid permease family protein [Penicillium odoratum]KAJ5759392.1 amino acid permease family protein [Penicillium odoratum]